jgi:threonine dehydratase
MRPSVTPDDIFRACERIHTKLRWTPVVESADGRGWLKLENLQKTGAYKVRGALNALMAQCERGDRRSVVAASAGNHAAGMAWAAREVGLDATAVVPVNAPISKIERTKAMGTEVILHGASFDEAEVFARRLAELRGARFLHPFEDPDIIAGQGTIAIEILGFDPDVVLVPIGGGGLASGVATALTPLGVRTIGVQVEGLDTMRQKLAGTPVAITNPESVADGVRVLRPGKRTAAILEKLLSDIVVVSELEVRDAMTRLADRERVVAEGAGAVATAALARVNAKRPLAIVSGGNIDLDLLRSVVAPRSAEHEPFRTGAR